MIHEWNSTELMGSPPKTQTKIETIKFFMDKNKKRKINKRKRNNSRKAKQNKNLNFSQGLDLCFLALDLCFQDPIPSSNTSGRNKLRLIQVPATETVGIFQSIVVSLQVKDCKTVFKHLAITLKNMHVFSLRNTIIVENKANFDREC